MCLHRVRRFPLHVLLITHQHKDGGCVYVEAGPLFLRLLALTACHTLDPHRQAVAGELASDQPPPSWDRHAASLPRRIYFEHPGNLLLCYLSRRLTLFVFFVFLFFLAPLLFPLLMSFLGAVTADWRRWSS